MWSSTTKTLTSIRIVQTHTRCPFSSRTRKSPFSKPDEIVAMLTHPNFGSMASAVDMIWFASSWASDIFVAGSFTITYSRLGSIIYSLRGYSVSAAAAVVLFDDGAVPAIKRRAAMSVWVCASPLTPLTWQDGLDSASSCLSRSRNYSHIILLEVGLLTFSYLELKQARQQMQSSSLLFLYW